MHHKEEELTVQDRVLYEKWQKQDIEQRLSREQRQQELQEQVELSALDNIQQEIEWKMKRLAMEREAKLLEVERMRSMRLAKEQSAEALESAERAALLLKKQQLLSNAVFSNDVQQSRQDEDMLQSLMQQEGQLSKQAQAIQQRKQALQQALQQISTESQDLLQAEQAVKLQHRKKEQDAKESMLYQDYLRSMQEADVKMQASTAELQSELQHLQLAKDLHSQQTMPIVYGAASASSGKTKKKVHMMDDEQPAVHPQPPQQQQQQQAASSRRHAAAPNKQQFVAPHNDEDTAASSVHEFDVDEDLLPATTSRYSQHDVEDVEMMPLDEAMHR